MEGEEMKAMTNKELKIRLDTLWEQYRRLVEIVCEIRDAAGVKPRTPANELPGIVRELKTAGVAQIEPAKAERAGSGPAPGDQKGKI